MVVGEEETTPYRITSNNSPYPNNRHPRMIPPKVMYNFFLSLWDNALYLNGVSFQLRSDRSI